MTIRNAIFLLNAIESDSQLREELYACNDNDELMANLKAQGCVFDTDAFEDAVLYLHAQCQTAEKAQLLMQKAEWLRYLLFMNKKT